MNQSFETIIPQKRGECMSEKEKQIIETVAEALPKMSERDKGYFLGYAEALASQKEEKKKKAGEVKR